MAWSLTNEDVRTVKLTNGDVTEIMYKDHVKVVTYDQQAICIEYSSDYNAPVFYANRSFKLYAYCLDWTECVAPGGTSIQDVIDKLNALLATSSTITIAKNGTTVGAEPNINLIEGSNVTLTVVDNPLTDSIDVTIDASGGGGGGVTAVTGTAPISSTGGTTPDISIAQADSGHDGYLSSTDWNTFNGKVDSVTATSPITSSGGTTPNISTNVNKNRLIGRNPVTAGVMEEISIGSGLSLSGTTLNASINQSITHATASGTDTYTATITGVTSYADGDVYLIRFTNGNTTGSTLNINSIGAADLYRNNDGLLIGGDIIAGAEMLLIYNSTLVGFQCIGVAPNTLLAYVTNAEAITITKGQPVYVFGGQGDRITVKLAYNTTDATSAQTIGIVQSTSIAANQKGFVIVQGQLDGLTLFPTATWSDGDYVYLGATAGTITNVKPHAPNHLVYLGYVTTASNGAAGRMYVKVQNGYEMDEIHNVSAQTPSNNDGLFYNTTTSLWESKSIATALSYTPVSTALLINTTAPLTGGGNLSADRTLAITQATTGADGYLSSTDWNTFNGKQAALVSGTNIKTVNSNSLLGSGDISVGTVTSVTGTSPIVSSGGTTPAISMPVATSGANGYLSSTDWNTFNGKQTSSWAYRKTGRWYTPSNNALATASITNFQNTIRYTAVIIDRDITVTQLGINVVTVAGAGTTCRIGIYSNDPTTTQPLTRLVDSGTLALDSTGPKTVTGLSVALTKGLYWFCYVSNATTGTVTAIANLNIPDVIGTVALNLGVITNYSQTYTYAALPASAGTLTGSIVANSVCTFYGY